MKKALIVGINNYPKCPLSGCINDANAMAQTLDRNGNGTKNFAIRLAIDVPSKGILKGLIDECFSNDDDIALFYFSGHGYIDDIGGYIVTPDFSDHDMGVSMQEIMAMVNNSKCKNKVVILDCCHSGFIGCINTTGQNASTIGEGVTLLTASKSSEAAMEISGHGVFTSLLLAALSGGAADITGNITPGGIYAYIDKSLGPWSQRPVFKTNITRFSPLKTVMPQVSEDILRLITSYFDRPDSEIKLNPSFEYTNTPTYNHDVIEPYADDTFVEMFKNLQRLESVGLVVPCEEEHMYFAAMRSKSCKLTPAGQHYWHLVNESII